LISIKPKLKDEILKKYTKNMVKRYFKRVREKLMNLEENQLIEPEDMVVPTSVGIKPVSVCVKEEPGIRSDVVSMMSI